MNSIDRPSADHSIEQFLMTPESRDDLTKELVGILQGKRVVFIGDDDHLSVQLSGQVDPVVLEIDQRVKDSLTLQLGDNAEVVEYDVRAKVPQDIEKADAFVINPPYSSKNQGLGIKVWLKRACEMTRPGGIGVMIIPWHFEEDWAVDNREAIKEFIEQNGMSIVSILDSQQFYDDVNHDNLFSNAIVLNRGFQEKIDLDIPNGDSIYR